MSFICLPACLLAYLSVCLPVSMSVPMGLLLCIYILNEEWPGGAAILLHILVWNAQQDASTQDGASLADEKPVLNDHVS